MRVSTSLTYKCRSLLLTLVLLPHSNYIAIWVIHLSLLQKLYPHISNLLCLNNEPCQYAKHRCVHLNNTSSSTSRQRTWGKSRILWGLRQHKSKFGIVICLRESMHWIYWRKHAYQIVSMWTYPWAPMLNLYQDMGHPYQTQGDIVNLWQS